MEQASQLFRSFYQRDFTCLFFLDRLQWLPGWKQDTSEEFDQKLASVLKQDKWIIDGNCLRTLSERLKYSDYVVFLDFHPLLCLWRTTMRIVRWHGETRLDVADGCPERFNWSFVCYVWNFRRDTKPRIETVLKAYSGALVHLKTPKEVSVFMENIHEREYTNVEN